MKARRKSDGKVIEVKEFIFIDENGDCITYYANLKDMYDGNDLDFDVEEISVAHLRKILNRYVTEYTYTRMNDNDVNNIINEVKSEL